MDRDHSNAFGIDPLGDLEVQRALALARARESYPAVPRETLLGYCDAAWQVALKADPGGHDLQGSFDRALLIIAWTQRRSGGRVPLRDLIDQTVPRIALQPFISERVPPPAVEDELAIGEVVDEPAPSRRSLLRVPFSSPLPVGAALAAGFVGIAVLNETEVLPIAPLQPTGGSGDSDDARAGDSEQRGSAATGGPARDAPEGGGLAQAWPGDGLADAASQVRAPAESGAAAGADAFEAGSAGAADELTEGGGAEALRDESTDQGFQTAVVRAPAPEPAAEVTAPPAPRPVVRIEMPPPTMIVEVSAPRTWREQPAVPETPTAPDGTGLPEDSAPEPEARRDAAEDEDRDRSGRHDEDDRRVPVLDVLTDESAPSEDEEELVDDGDGDEAEDGGDSQPAPRTSPATPPVSTPPAAEPTPAEPVAPAEPSAPAAPSETPLETPAPAGSPAGAPPPASA